MEIRLSDHFSYSRLLRFTWPTMLMMVITSIYGVVDGLMVSNFAGTTQFAALNLIWPFVAILGSTGMMLGTGGSALVGKKLGQGDRARARELFSMLTISTLALGVILGFGGLFAVRPVAIALGADGEMAELCTVYGSILLITLPAFVMQVYFQSLLITAERPKMGMWVMIGAGVTNVILDLLFIGAWGWGVRGAAWATAAGEFVGGGIPLVYFLTRRCRRTSTLYLCRFRFDFRALGQASLNGVSEFVMNISLSIVSMLYMYALLREAGENGVAAYGIMMYFAFTFLAIFIGYGIGSAPVISYHYGAGNHAELRSLLRKSLTLLTGIGFVIVTLAQSLARPLSAIFVSYDPELLSLTIHAFRIYSLMFLVAGINIFASAFFTALNNGPVSALISMLRTIVFEAGCVLVLPLIFGIEGIWWSVFVAEGTTSVISLLLIWKYRLRYNY